MLNVSVYQDECKYWGLTCQHSHRQLCQSARTFPLHCHTTSSQWIKNKPCSFIWVPNAAAKRLVVLNYRHPGKSTLNDKTTISAEHHLKIQLEIPEKSQCKKEQAPSHFREAQMRSYTHTVFISHPFLWMPIFWCWMQNTIPHHSMITPPSAWSIPCTLDSCSAH